MSEKKTETKKIRPLRLVGRILAWILAALLLFLLVMYIIPLTETGDRTAVEGTADWMRELPDETPLNALVLPGTHDSATRYVQLGFFSKCQSKSLWSSTLLNPCPCRNRHRQRSWSVKTNAKRLS